MPSDRKKPGVVFWTIVAVMAVLAYPLSIRPAGWLVRMEVLSVETLAHAYWPLVMLRRAPRPIERVATWYAGKDQWGADLLYVMSARADYEAKNGFGAP